MPSRPLPHGNHQHDDEPDVTPLPVDTASRRRVNRRVVLKAAAGVAALTASGMGLAPKAGAPPAVAQEADGTRARRYVPAENGVSAADAAQGEWVSVQTEFPFWSLGASWPGDVGLWPLVAVQLSADGETWTETIDIAANTEDGGQPRRDDRLFTPLIFTDGARWFRYQTLDAERRVGEVADLSFVYIDPTDGPWEADIAPESRSIGGLRLASDTFAPPEIVTRAQWGANENWRFGEFGEIWPPEYETVTHIIIHHTATTNRPTDVPGAIRSIYYYHAVEQEWGDIGYNYLVDHNGRIYQGRYGGQDVIGGHSYQFAIGSSGIGTIGNFANVDITEAAKSALVSICAWVGRDLDPLGASDFQEAPNLPTIASHRDVNATSCPGDRLWNDLPELRTLVAQTLDSGELETGFPAGIAPGDRVRVQTDDGSALNLRSSPTGSVVGSLDQDETAWVIDGPEKLGDGNWYRVEAEFGSETGWATAEFLIVDPPLPPGNPASDYPFGLNLQIVQSVNIRRSPSLSGGIVATAPSGTLAFVLAAPVTADGYVWYWIDTQGFGDGWVINDSIVPLPVDENPDGVFDEGDAVRATQSLNIRPRPGLPQTVITTAPSGSAFVISQPPIAVTGYIWYGVYSTSYGGGWVVEDYLQGTTPPPAGKFEIGDTFRVTQATNLRTAPSTSGSVLVTMGAGTTGSVLDGPRTGNGYTWWQVRLSNGTVGWSVENWLVETDDEPPPPPPTGTFEIGDTVRVTARLNLRSSASTSGSVIAVLQVNATGTVLAGPTAANGYVWWQLQTSQGTGWCVENWLVETSAEPPPPPPPTGRFEPGDTVRVTERVNFRTGAGTSNSVIRVVQVNETGTVQGGPANANGFVWWQVTFGGRTGWAIEDVLVEGSGTTPPPPSGGLPAGTVVRVTADNLRMRSSASTSATILAVLPVNEQLTIVSGPTSASGYDWYQVTSATYGTGYVADDFIARV